QQFGGVPYEIGGRGHANDGPAVIRRSAVDHRVPIVVDEDLEINTEAPAVVEQSLVAVWNAPRSGVEVLALREIDVLDGTAQFLVACPVANGPHATACAI